MKPRTYSDKCGWDHRWHLMEAKTVEGAKWATVWERCTDCEITRDFLMQIEELEETYPKETRTMETGGGIEDHGRLPGLGSDEGVGLPPGDSIHTDKSTESEAWRMGYLEGQIAGYKAGTRRCLWWAVIGGIALYSTQFAWMLVRHGWPSW